MPRAELVGVVAARGEAEVRDRRGRAARPVLVVAERRPRAAARNAAPRVAVAELGGRAALVDRVAEHRHRPGDARHQPRRRLVARRPARRDVAGRDQRRRRRGDEQRERRDERRAAIKLRRAAAASRSSAIWIAFSAAPLRRLSPTTKSARPLLDRRVAADPADEHVVAAGGAARRRELLEPDARRARRASRVACSGESGCSVSSQTASAWPTSTGTRTHVALIGSSGSSRILRVSSRSFSSSSNSTPSKLQSMRRSCSSGDSAAEPLHRLRAGAGDRLVGRDPHARRGPAASCSGFSAQVSGIAQQFGFATMPSCSAARAPFTSGTTSGTPGSSR